MKKTPMYRYYDTPDGEDYFKKLYCIMRPALPISLSLAMTDVYVFTKPVGLFPVTERFVRIFCRPTITSFLFPTTVYIATKLRKKDDAWNHALGGLVCGYYWRNYIACNPLCIWLTIVFSAALYFSKKAKLGGMQLYYNFYDIQGEWNHNAMVRFTEWSWSKQYPRTWLTAEEAAAKGIQE